MRTGTAALLGVAAAASISLAAVSACAPDTPEISDTDGIETPGTVIHDADPADEPDGTGVADGDPADGDLGDMTGRTTRFAYGGHADAFGDLTLPAAEQPAGGWPVVVLIHGGFWRDGFFLDLMEPLVPSLIERGVAVWNVEYRRVGAGGGYPETLEDVAAAVDHLATLDQADPGVLDLARVATVGHSAGGHLAVWAASRSALPANVPGGEPAVRPVLAVSQAGVLDLRDCDERGVGGDACLGVLGGRPADVPDRVAVASPIELLPTTARVVLIHGDGDDIVPLRQSERYLEAARAAGVDVTLVVTEGAGHFEHLDPQHPMWDAALEALAFD